MTTKTYDVIIDRSSSTVTVTAVSEEDAANKAFQVYREEHRGDFESWVAEVDVV